MGAPVSEIDLEGNIWLTTVFQRQTLTRNHQQRITSNGKYASSSLEWRFKYVVPILNKLVQKHHTNSLIQIYWNDIESAFTKISRISVFIWVNRVRKRTDRFTPKVCVGFISYSTYIANFKYLCRTTFEISSHKKLFCDNRTGEQTYSSLPNF